MGQFTGTCGCLLPTRGPLEALDDTKRELEIKLLQFSDGNWKQIPRGSEDAMASWLEIEAVLTQYRKIVRQVLGQLPLGLMLPIGRPMLTLSENHTCSELEKAGSTAEGLLLEVSTMVQKTALILEKPLKGKKIT